MCIFGLGYFPCKTDVCFTNSELSKDGFVCYDQSIGDDVLAFPWILCHLGDSPMHAEITNTNNPSTTLNPCRLCVLGVNERADKQNDKYLRDFVGIDDAGHKVCKVSLFYQIVWVLTLVNKFKLEEFSSTPRLG